MNSAFVRYEELSRSRRVLSTSADNTLLDLLNSSYPTQPHSLTANYVFTLSWPLGFGFFQIKDELLEARKSLKVSFLLPNL